MPATLGRAVQRQAEVGQATGEESLAQAVLKGECWQHGPGGVGSAGCLVSDGSPGATSATGQAAGGHPPPAPAGSHTSSSSMRRSVSVMNLMYWLVSVVSSL